MIGSREIRFAVIVRAFGGAYADRRVQDYVTRVGESLAQRLERRRAEGCIANSRGGDE